MKRVRILVDEMPRLLREIVEAAVRFQPDMELVNAPDGNDLPMVIKGRQVDVVIAGEREADNPGLGEQLLLKNPHLKVVVVTEDGREARLFELRQVRVPDVSPQGLVDAIRAAVADKSRTVISGRRGSG